MSLRVLASALLVASQLAWLSAVFAQVFPVGPEFEVNTYSTNRQGLAAVAADGAGNFVVVWNSNGSAGSDTSGYSIQGQRYDSGGVPLGSQFQVNSYTTGRQAGESVAVDGAGNFVVVWSSSGSAGSDTSGYSVQGQRYDSTGAAVGGEFQVNTYTTGPQGVTQNGVAFDGAGNFVVVWGGLGGGSDSGGSVQGQRYDGNGMALGGQFQVNTFTTAAQGAPAVAADAAGNFVVVWRGSVFGYGGLDDAAEFGIRGQRYDAGGTAQGGEFQIDAYMTGEQYDPVVRTDSVGNFIVVWYGPQVEARRYDNVGTPLGGEDQVNTFPVSVQSDFVRPSLAIDAAGDSVVVWGSPTGAGSDTSELSVQGQRYDAAGTAQGNEFQVNTYTPFRQWFGSVTADTAGNFVVVWNSEVGHGGPDTSYSSILGQRFLLTTTSSTSTSSTTSTTAPTTDLLPGRIIIIKPSTLAKFVAKPITGDTFTLPTANPITDGGSLRMFDANSMAGDNTYALPLGASWKGLGNPAGSKGYKYKGAGTPGDPCKVVLLKETVIKGVCKGTGITLAPPFTGEVGIILSLGTTDRYCASFGGDTVKEDATLTKRKNAPAPGACP